MNSEDYAKAAPLEQLLDCQARFTDLVSQLNHLRQNKSVASRELSLAYTDAQAAGFWLKDAVELAKVAGA